MQTLILTGIKISGSFNYTYMQASKLKYASVILVHQDFLLLSLLWHSVPPMVDLNFKRFKFRICI